MLDLPLLLPGPGVTAVNKILLLPAAISTAGVVYNMSLNTDSETCRKQRIRRILEGVDTQRNTVISPATSCHL